MSSVCVCQHLVDSIVGTDLESTLCNSPEPDVKFMIWFRWVYMYKYEDVWSYVPRFYYRTNESLLVTGETQEIKAVCVY